MKKIQNPAYGRYAKKRFGQNFLHDANIARKIVDTLHIEPQDKVIEIGPGHCALSVHIADANPALYAAVERDLELAMELRDKCPDVEPLAADALSIRWEGLPQDASWKVVGNLPYNIASPLMWELFSRGRAVTRAVFMIQKEVGQRLVAEAGGRAYGALTVWVQSFVKPRYEFTVSPNVFIPRPKVESAVLSFTPHENPGHFDPRALSGLVKLCFQNRRKQVGKILKSLWNDEVDEWFRQQGLSAKVRPEDLTPNHFQALSVLTKTHFMA